MNPNQNFCIGGQWKHWSEMSTAEKAAKISIAQSSGDEAMEKKWLAVEIES